MTLPRPPIRTWRYRLRRFFRPPRKLKLTKEGRLFVAITVGLGLAAINTGNNLLYLMLGWLLSAIVASGILAELTLRKLKLTRSLPAAVHAGSEFVTSISATNLKNRFASYSIEIEDEVFEASVGKKCFFLKIPARSAQKASYRLTHQQRGVYRYTGYRIATRFPFGLFNKSCLIDQDATLTVFPTLKKMPPLIMPPSGIGESKEQRVDRSGNFRGLREYVNGDDRRSIHWRSSAKRRQLVVREHERETNRHMTLVFDNYAPPIAASNQNHSELSTALELEFEDAISECATLAVHYLRSGFSVELITRSCTVPRGTGAAAEFVILSELAVLAPSVTPTPLPVEDARGDVVFLAPGKTMSNKPSAVEMSA